MRYIASPKAYWGSCGFKEEVSLSNSNIDELVVNKIKGCGRLCQLSALGILFFWLLLLVENSGFN